MPVFSFMITEGKFNLPKCMDSATQMPVAMKVMFQANTITEHHPTQTASQLDISEMEEIDKEDDIIVLFLSNTCTQVQLYVKLLILYVY